MWAFEVLAALFSILYVRREFRQKVDILAQDITMPHLRLAVFPRQVLNELITFALPMILIGVLQQFYSIVNLMIAKKFVGDTGTIGVFTKQVNL